MGKKESDLNNVSPRKEYAHGYDSAMTVKMHASRTVDKQARWFLPYLQAGMSLLDCGCGSGSITIGLAKVVAPGQVTGVDISEIEIKRAQDGAAAAGITNIRFEVGNIYQLDYSDNSFDALFSHNVLEHVGKPEKALREMKRVLKPEGVIGIRNTDMGGFLLTPDAELIHRFLAIYEANWQNVGGHPRLGRYSRRLLTEAGFVEVAASASYEVHSNLEDRRSISQILAARVTEADFVKQVLESGLANADDLEAMHAAWLAWPESSDAFFARAYGEAVGRKA
jgi:ubiquinone/menaquinone biosynthesis C-methylase UbiE